jgi:uncharacterized membrane protein (Fun14 family)
MTTDPPALSSRPTTATLLTRQLATMPGWHRAVLSLATLVAVVGAAGWVVGAVASRTTEAQVAGADDAATAPGGRLLPSGSPERPPPSAAPEPSTMQRLSPLMMRTGASLLVGFIAGFLFRAFIKMMTLVTLLIGGTFFVLTYLGIVDFDLTAARNSYQNATHWLREHAAW